jgi:cytochrome c-type biogenesis protein
MIGVFRIKLFEYDTRVQQVPDRKWGYLSSALMGVFFSAGWAPCVGPVLGAILTLSLNGGSISVGATLLSAYSAGLAVPFLIAALGIGWVSVTLKKYGKLMHYVEIVMGVVLVIIGFALFSGIYEKYAALLSQNVWIDFGI